MLTNGMFIEKLIPTVNPGPFLKSKVTETPIQSFLVYRAPFLSLPSTQKCF